MARCRLQTLGGCLALASARFVCGRQLSQEKLAELADLQPSGLYILLPSSVELGYRRPHVEPFGQVATCHSKLTVRDLKLLFAS